MTASAERLMNIENFEDDSSDILENSEIHKLYHNELVEIVFQNADFTYKKSNDIFVLKNLDLQIKKGEFIALTGYSGCGKSTLFKLLMCLYKLDS